LLFILLNQNICQYLFYQYYFDGVNVDKKYNKKTNSFAKVQKNIYIIKLEKHIDKTQYLKI